MGDIALAWQFGAADAFVRGGDLATDEGLRTAVLLSLFTDRRAEPDDPLPGEDGDLRGYWADEFAASRGDRHGSRLWLLERSKRTGDVIPQAEQFAREALAWMLDDKVTGRIDVLVELDQVGLPPGLFMQLTFYRPQSDPVSFRFLHVWEGEAGRSSVGADQSPAPPSSGFTSSLGSPLLTARGEVSAYHRAHAGGRDVRTVLHEAGWYLLP